MRIGIDLGGTKIEGIVMGPDLNVVEGVRRPTPAGEGYAAILAALTGSFEKKTEQRAPRTAPFSWELLVVDLKESPLVHGGEVLVEDPFARVEGRGHVHGMDG